MKVEQFAENGPKIGIAWGQCFEKPLNESEHIEQIYKNLPFIENHGLGLLSKPV